MELLQGVCPHPLCVASLTHPRLTSGCGALHSGAQHWPRRGHVLCRADVGDGVCPLLRLEVALPRERPGDVRIRPGGRHHDRHQHVLQRHVCLPLLAQRGLDDLAARHPGAPVHNLVFLCRHHRLRLSRGRHAGTPAPLDPSAPLLTEEAPHAPRPLAAPTLTLRTRIRTRSG